MLSKENLRYASKECDLNASFGTSPSTDIKASEQSSIKVLESFKL